MKNNKLFTEKKSDSEIKGNISKKNNNRKIVPNPISLDTATWRVTTDKVQKQTPFLIIREQVGTIQNSSFWLRTITSNRMTIWRQSLKNTRTQIKPSKEKPKRHSTWKIKY